MNRLELAAQPAEGGAAAERRGQVRRRRPEANEPGERVTVPRRQLAVSYALAFVLPTATAALLVPFRAAHPQTIALILVIPVVLVAARGATGPALVAAAIAGIAYDVFLTQPYYHVAIDNSDDVVAAIALVIVAAIVGLLSGRLVRLRARDCVRGGELGHLLDFAGCLRAGVGPDQLIDAARVHIAGILDLRDCRWIEACRGGEGPVLYPDGSVSGLISALNPDRATLPRDLELPAVAAGTEIGHFVLSPRPGSVTSYEERLTAATIARVLAHELTRPASS